MTAKQQKAAMRTSAAAEKRRRRRAAFLIKLASRRGKVVEESPCQQGYTQVVVEAEQAGGAWFYKSAVCTGCQPGETFINKIFSNNENTTNIKPPKNCIGCTLVKNNWLVSHEPVKIGDIVTARAPVQL